MDTSRNSLGIKLIFEDIFTFQVTLILCEDMGSRWTSWGGPSGAGKKTDIVIKILSIFWCFIKQHTITKHSQFLEYWYIAKSSCNSVAVQNNKMVTKHMTQLTPSWSNHPCCHFCSLLLSEMWNDGGFPFKDVLTVFTLRH